MGDLVVWLKRLVVKLQLVDDVASLLLLYLVGDALEEDNQKDINQIKAWLKEVFTDDAFTAYRELTMVKWAVERVDIYTNIIGELVGLIWFEGVWLIKQNFISWFPDAISIEL